MKAKEYDVLCMAIENGVAAGWRRAHKYVEAPEPEEIQSKIYDGVLGEILEWFDLEPRECDSE